MTPAQLITLVLIATSHGGATSQRLGRFYDMESCQKAGARAALVGATSELHVTFACVPLTPVASTPLLERR